MPVKHLIQGLSHQNIHDRIMLLANGLEYREFVIAGILIKKAIADPEEKSNTLKDNWIYLQDNKVKAGRLQIFNNWSPYMVNDPDTMWVGVEYFCNASDEFWKKTENEIAAIAIGEMESIGFIKADDVIDHVVIKVEKAYPSYTGTYDRFEEIITYLDKFQNLYPVGRNGMHRYNNTDHSMLTAMQAVENIKAGTKSKRNIWDINLEEDYHEEK
jgi:protoporphyrinogen oxidase